MKVPETAWEDCNGMRLLAQIQINGVQLHLEAWPVNNNARTQVGIYCDADFQAIAAAVGADGPFQTVAIKGRDYVLIATPRCI